MADGSKTEKPTPRRRQKAREQGQLARSRELITGAATVAAILVIASRSQTFLVQWHTLFSRTLDASGEDAGAGGLLAMLRWNGFLALGSAGLVLSLGWGTALLAAVAQGGLVFSPSSLAFRGSRMSPAASLRAMFSLPSLGRLMKSLLPVAAIVYLGTAIALRDGRQMVDLPGRSLAGAERLLFFTLYEIAWKSSFILLVWAGVDYLLERQRVEGELRMTRQETLDEYKETEGNPAVKARLRRLQRQLRKRRMLEDVKRAAVIITNPTEFAVALEYQPPMNAPRVVAKGRNFLARQIKEIARWQGIPAVENLPLAHALYRSVEVGQSIPVKLYAAVAGILAAIYRAQAAAERSARGGAAATVKTVFQEGK